MAPTARTLARRRQVPVRRRRWPRRVLIALAILIALVGGALLAAPSIGRWYLTERLIPRLSKRFVRRIDVGSVDVGYHRVKLTKIAVEGAGDGKRPLLSAAEVTVDYAWPELLGGRLVVSKVTVSKPKISVHRDREGRDNVSDLLRRRKRSGAGRGRVQIAAIRLRDGDLQIVDAQHRVRLGASPLSGTLVPGGRSQLELDHLRIQTPFVVPKKLAFDRVSITGHIGRGAKKLPRMTLHGGRVRLLPRLVLSAIGGTITPSRQGRDIALKLHGSYGGATARLWSATGRVQPLERVGKLELRAARFHLERIRSILTETPVIKPERTTVNGRLDLRYARGSLHFEGALAISGLNLFHPMLARIPVLDLGGSVELAGDLSPDELDLKRCHIEARGIAAELDGKIERLQGKPRVELELRLPPVKCSEVLAALPASLVPHLQGFELRGKLTSDIHAKVDFADLDQTELGGKLGIYRCKVVKAPARVSAERLLEPFSHTVEPEPAVYRTFIIGPENPDFTPYSEISPYVIKAFLTTEDAGFFRHRGFIPSQFEKALARNLKRGGFRLGASTISMQTVKNVLLSHEKTLSRKLQELFLVWYIEKHLSKERLMEIYLNAIEFGPDVFGIGQAARHYFGKKPSEITALEAAFFATILPSPVRRYRQYCHGALSKRWDHYVHRVLRRMHSREHITDEELEAAKDQQIVFSRDMEALPEKACLDDIKRIRQAWREEHVRRLKEAVMRAAPHQLEMYLAEVRNKSAKK